MPLDTLSDNGDQFDAQPGGEAGWRLLDDITAAIRRHVALGGGRAEAVALWVLHAHSLDAHVNNPRLHLRSPVLGSGKTTLASIIALLTHQHSKMVSHCTPAAFFRMVEAGKVKTILLDEADQFISADRKDALAILNSGHHRAGASVLRCDGENYEPRSFNTWAAVVVGSIGALPPTLESRSIIIDILRKRRDEHVERVRRADETRLKELGNRAALWAKDHFDALSNAEPDIPDCLYNRDQDNWYSLLAIADAAGGHWPETARAIASALNGLDEDPSEGVMLLADIRPLFIERGVDRLDTKSLLHALCKDEERPWCEYDRGAGITDRQLARLLKMFAIRPNSIRMPDDKTPKGYMLEWFQDAFDRYLRPNSADPAPAATSATENDLS